MENAAKMDLILKVVGLILPSSEAAALKKKEKEEAAALKKKGLMKEKENQKMIVDSLNKICKDKGLKFWNIPIPSGLIKINFELRKFAAMMILINTNEDILEYLHHNHQINIRDCGAGELVADFIIENDGCNIVFRWEESDFYSFINNDYILVIPSITEDRSGKNFRFCVQMKFFEAYFQTNKEGINDGLIESLEKSAAFLKSLKN